MRRNFPRSLIVIAIFGAGVLFWGGFNWSLELTNTESFCISCHAMKSFLYEEYKTTVHYNNRTGVRASCPDCHVPKEWVHKVVRKIQATNELFHWAVGSIDTKEKFEARRPELATHVWQAMSATDSRECRNCHGIEWMSVQTPVAAAMHAYARGWQKTCIDCHKGIAHRPPNTYSRTALMDELHVLLERDSAKCVTCHTDMTRPRKGDDW